MKLQVQQAVQNDLTDEVTIFIHSEHVRRNLKLVLTIFRVGEGGGKRHGSSGGFKYTVYKNFSLKMYLISKKHNHYITLQLQN